MPRHLDSRDYGVALRKSMGMATESTTLEETGDKFEHSLNLMGTNIKLLSITGIIPSKKISSNFWKCRTYRLCQLLSYLLYALVLTLQVVGLHQYWGDMIVTTDNIAVAATFMIGYIPTIFTIQNNSKINTLIDNLETKSIFSFRNIRSNRKCMEVILEAKSLVSYLTWFSIVSLLITIFFWTVYPLALLMYRSEHELTQRDEDLRVKFQYFVFVMWVPSNANQPCLYGIIYLFQVITFSMSLIYLIGLVPLYLSLIVYATAQFKIVSTTITEIDDVSTTIPYEEANKRVRNLVKMEERFFGKFKSSEQPKSVSCDKQWECKNKPRGQALESCTLRCEVVKQHHAIPTHADSPHVPINSSTNNDEADSTTVRLVECIKLHQSAIRSVLPHSSYFFSSHTTGLLYGKVNHTLVNKLPSEA